MSNNFGKIFMGRWYYGKKDEADWYNSLSVYWLNKHGYIPRESDDYFFKSGGIKWVHNSGSESGIGFNITKSPEEGCKINFKYTNTDRETGEKKSMDYSFDLISTPCNLGGERYWFRCGLYSNGVYCGRRVGTLYVGGKYLGCRHCYNLTYMSRNESRGGRFYYFGEFLKNETKVEKLEAKIKRKYYRGKPTRKYKQLLKLQHSYYDSAVDYLRAENKLDEVFGKDMMG